MLGWIHCVNSGITFFKVYLSNCLVSLFFFFPFLAGLCISNSICIRWHGYTHGENGGGYTHKHTPREWGGKAPIKKKVGHSITPSSN